jgi:ferredoxin
VTYVIAQPCAESKDNSCVAVCPVDCIHPSMDEPGFDEAAQLYIDPVECIDCGACVPECPVDAIFAADDVPAEWQEYIEINVRYYAA